MYRFLVFLFQALFFLILMLWGLMAWLFVIAFMSLLLTMIIYAILYIGLSFSATLFYIAGYCEMAGKIAHFAESGVTIMVLFSIIFISKIICSIITKELY